MPRYSDAPSFGEMRTKEKTVYKPPLPPTIPGPISGSRRRSIPNPPTSRRLGATLDLARAYDRYAPESIRYADGALTGEKRSTPPQWILDADAERRMTGGFRIRKDNLCPGCGEYRSVNGMCGCRMHDR